jgi:hypothetical protein
MALIPIALAVGAMSASAAPILITFESDPVDFIEGNDFTSDGFTQIHFIDTVPDSPGQGDMLIIDGSSDSTNDTNALAVAFGGDDDDSALRIVFDLPATSIHMDLFFGGYYSPQDGDTAELTAYWVEDGDVVGDVVGTVSVNLSDGQIAFDAETFNKVEIKYVVPGGLTEIVDNVRVALIPEPDAAVLFIVGALMVGAACRRRSPVEAPLRLH